MPLRIAILGATGHVGRLVLRNLLSTPPAAVSHVLTLDRREVDAPSGDARLSRHVVDMSSGETLASAAVPLLDGVDVVVATMGIGSGIGRLETFRRVEVELPAAFARAAVTAGARRAVLLTAGGADVDNRFSFLLPHVARGKYFHLKGLVEQRYADAGFADGVDIFRPGGLLGTDHLPGFVDGILRRVDGMFPERFRCIHIERLAQAMAGVVLSPPEGGGVVVYEAATLFALLDDDRRSGASATR
jgi:nucleoside-diphosphate-sugar epimerase